MESVRRVDTFEGTFQALKNEISKQDPMILGVVVAVVVVLLTIILFLLVRRKNNRRSILLVGVCDVGKTLLFSRLVHNKYINSFTSIKENSGVYQLTGRKTGTLEVVDLPGNNRQRMIFWDRFKNQARGLIFVIDSTAFQNERMKEVAEFLYTLLSDQVTSQNKLAVLVACNKQDVAMAKSSKIMQDKLEKEINTLRETRTSSLDSTDGSSGSEVFLGARGKDFKFSQLSPVSVELVECSAKGASDDGTGQGELNVVEEWLQSIA